MAPKKPMLACDAPADIRFPVLASPKLDGIRGIWAGGQMFTRALKLVPNKHVQALAAAAQLPANFEGELVVGEANHPDVYRRTTSGVMSHEGQPDAAWWIYDYQCDDGITGAFNRYSRLSTQTSAVTAFNPWIKVLPQQLIQSMEQLEAAEAKALADGFEGLMLKAVHGTYKFGRSTAKEQLLMKVKRFTDDEAVVIGVEEEMFNGNAATTNELGNTKRSSHQENLVGKGRLGALVCRTQAGIEFKIGTGFTALDREQLWAIRDTLPGRLAKYKSFEHGVKDKPRHPVWHGFRDPRDL